MGDVAGGVRVVPRHVSSLRQGRRSPSFIAWLRRGPARTALAVGLAAGLTGAASAQDSLQLTDGRFVVGPKMSRDERGVVVHFNNGEVLVRSDLVRDCTALDASANAQKWTEAEKAKLAQGQVFFEGKWVPQARRDQILAERRGKRAARIEEAKKHRKWGQQYRTETPHFVFEYTVDPELMQGYMDMMEVYFKTFTKEWGITKPSNLGKLSVCFFHDEDYFHQVSGAPPGVIGYFKFVEPLELHFFHDRLDPDMTVDVMFHETNHYLTYLIDPTFHYPPWINESLAEYYGASVWDPVGKKMTTGELQEGRLAVLQDMISRGEEMQDLEALIRLEHGAFNAIHYAWGWSLMHYLFSDKKLGPKLKKFYLGLARDNDVKRVAWNWNFKTVESDEQIRLFKKYLGFKDLKELETAWHAYVKGLQPVSHRGYENAGSFALSRGMPLKAQRLLGKAIEMGSVNPVTHYQLGEAFAQKDQWEQAIEHYRKALELDPLAGLFYVELAEAMERKGDAKKSELDRLRRLAFEVEPDNFAVVQRVADELGELPAADGK